MKKESRIFSLERKILDFVENHINIIIFSILILLSLGIRYLLLSYESADYIIFLKPWFNTLKEGGGLRALANYPGDYNAPYMTIMALLTYLKINPLISIKMVTIFFEYLLSFIVGKFIYDIFEKNKNRKVYAMVGSLSILFLPTILLDGAFWAQCDVIYTTFVVFALYFLYKDKITISFLFLGLAFAFKLQFIFILPVYVILYFRKKNFSILNFFIIPLVNFILCLPAIIAGKPIIDCMLVYVRQTSTYNSLNLNFPNIYSLVNGIPHYLSKIGMVMLVLAFAFIFWYIIKNRIKFNFEKILLLSIWSVVMCTFLLPYMHERYMFVADILSLLYFIIYRRNLLVALGIEFISLVSYTMFLFNNYEIPSYLLALTFLTICLYLSKDLKEKLLK